MARSFDTKTLTRLRLVSLADALNALGFYVKVDRDYVPVKNPGSQRWWISEDATVHEVLVTGEKWFDQRNGSGGGGAIDLCMHLKSTDFVGAVKLLLKAGL